MQVDILISDVTKLSTRTKVDDGILTTQIQFEARVPVASIARILNLQRQGAPIMATLGSAQAVMDLQFSEITGRRRETTGVEG